MDVAVSVSAPHDWIFSLRDHVSPQWQAILEGAWAEGITHGRLSLEQMQDWMLQMYPFIHTFPKFLAAALLKVEDDEARDFYINNIRVEKAHAEHWLWMGQGFGVPASRMLALAEGNMSLDPQVQTLTDWLWHINLRGSLAEAAAATSFAIEGVTGDIARKVTKGFALYARMPGTDLGPRAYRWMREHAHYDDDHPKIALEIAARYAPTERLQVRVGLAARRSLQLLHNALLSSIGVPVQSV
jgi:pyrroloquinoline quinone (PQQ) biosynthesis protein C